MINGKSEHRHWIQHIRVSLVTAFQLKVTTLIFGPNLLKKGISGLKQKNPSFACARGCYLLYQTFPQGGQQTLQYFNVSSVFSRRDNGWFYLSEFILIWYCNIWCLIILSTRFSWLFLVFSSLFINAEYFQNKILVHLPSPKRPPSS